MSKDDLENFINGMKLREADERRLSEDHLARAETIQGERMKLEHFRYQIEKRDAQIAKSGV